MTTPTKPVYAFQCISGEHVGAILPGTELETKAKEREAQGFVDAIPLRSSECPWCVDDARERQERMWYELGCPKSGHEFTECNCTPTLTPSSPYQGQVTGIHNL